MIRGFPIGEGNTGEVALNGVYGVAPNYQLLPQYLERIELLKGPGAGLYGMSPNGGVGGVINAVTKGLQLRILNASPPHGSPTTNSVHMSMSVNCGLTRTGRCGESVLTVAVVVAIWHSTMPIKIRH